MAAEVAIDDERGLVSVVFAGPVGAGDFIAVFQDLCSTPAFRPGMKILVDMLAHVHQVTGEDMRRIAAVLAQNGQAMSGTQVAVVVGRPVSYGMTRMLQTFLEDAPFRISVFYEMDEARRWLDVA